MKSNLFLSAPARKETNKNKNGRRWKNYENKMHGFWFRLKRIFFRMHQCNCDIFFKFSYTKRKRERERKWTKRKAKCGLNGQVSRNEERKTKRQVGMKIYKKYDIWKWLMKKQSENEDSSRWIRRLARRRNSQNNQVSYCFSVANTTKLAKISEPN